MAIGSPFELASTAPDEVLAKAVRDPLGNPSIPQYVALTELQKRQTLRTEAAATKPPTEGTVADRLLAPQGFAGGGQVGMGAMAYPNFALGQGIGQGFAEGGEVSFEDYVAKVIDPFEGRKNYSTNNRPSRSPNAARGRYQFIPSTYAVYADDPNDWSPGAQDRAAKRLFQRSKEVLRKEGLPVTMENLYMQHWLGENPGGGGVRFAKTDPNIPLAAALPGSVISQNPLWTKGARTAGDVQQRIASAIASGKVVPGKPRGGDDTGGDMQYAAAPKGGGLKAVYGASAQPAAGLEYANAERLRAVLDSIEVPRIAIPKQLAKGQQGNALLAQAAQLLNPPKQVDTGEDDEMIAMMDRAMQERRQQFAQLHPELAGGIGQPMRMARGGVVRLADGGGLKKYIRNPDGTVSEVQSDAPNYDRYMASAPPFYNPNIGATGEGFMANEAMMPEYERLQRARLANVPQGGIDYVGGMGQKIDSDLSSVLRAAGEIPKFGTQMREQAEAYDKMAVADSPLRYGLGNLDDPRGTSALEAMGDLARTPGYLWGRGSTAAAKGLGSAIEALGGVGDIPKWLTEKRFPVEQVEAQKKKAQAEAGLNYHEGERRNSQFKHGGARKVHKATETIATTAQPSQQEATQETLVDAVRKAEMGELEQMVQGLKPDSAAAEARMAERHEENRRLALLQAGLGIAAGKSPHFAANLAGAQPAIQQYQRGETEIEQMNENLLSRQDAYDQALVAARLGDKKLALAMYTAQLEGAQAQTAAQAKIAEIAAKSGVDPNKVFEYVTGLTTDDPLKGKVGIPIEEALKKAAQAFIGTRGVMGTLSPDVADK